jgi:hypothetical protein
MKARWDLDTEELELRLTRKEAEMVRDGLDVLHPDSDDAERMREYLHSGLAGILEGLPDADPHEPPEPPEPRVYHDIAIESDGVGGAFVHHDTNDDDDDGVIDAGARWTDHWKEYDRAVKAMGGSRVGVSGVQVSVYVDGQKV